MGKQNDSSRTNLGSSESVIPPQPVVRHHCSPQPAVPAHHRVR